MADLLTKATKLSPTTPSIHTSKPLFFPKTSKNRLFQPAFNNPSTSK